MDGPGSRVLAAFGLSEPAVRLAGGQGETWRSGDVVLKRADAEAAAVAVADALCWYGATPDLAARWAHLPEWGQMLVRALIYRLTTDELAGGAATWTEARRAAYAPVIGLAVSYAG
ncbi:hypothetical protein [Kribbella sp. NPDC050459]|uniref:hypothetical protein n=1 Tax=Kribbella sp. NPDC050459 TaxID=3155785 RepID=UPI0033F7DF36